MNRFAALALLFLAPCAHAQSLKDTTPNISVIGEAGEEGRPDRATLFVGVMTDRPSAAEAAAENARASEAVIAELKAQGVEASDIRTDGVGLAPAPEPDRAPPQNAKKPQPRQFRARNDLVVVVRDVGRVGRIVGAIIDKGANDLANVAFSFSDEEERMGRLRVAAIENAERKARAYVEAIGLRLARVIEIHPLDEAPAPRFAAMAAPEAPATRTVPIEPGRRRLASRVSVVWAVAK